MDSLIDSATAQELYRRHQQDDNCDCCVCTAFMARMDPETMLAEALDGLKPVGHEQICQCGYCQIAVTATVRQIDRVVLAPMIAALQARAASR